ncbi:microfibril-associated glycoprotein 4-like [Toxorhynchites rutilus septentrionalis]|uniref:microfibril-associated glycoprotein 4-like n=1 Tax=Toxorhynchites rutilus septentrionalis TaxID=329112 RepID=UPI00247AE125|nr:microfibril-associated glycoprotein 4-like [Toxorhynchites rutilus septentrionalis]
MGLTVQLSLAIFAFSIDVLADPIANESTGVSVDRELQELRNRLDLLYVTNSEQIEALVSEIHRLRTAVESVGWLSERMERSLHGMGTNHDVLLRNVTTLTMQSNEIVENQRYCANHEALKNMFFELTPRCNVSGGHLLPPFPNSTVDPGTSNRLYRSCSEAPDRSGVYRIALNGNSSYFEAYCEQEKYGGRWLVFQRRQDGSVSFNRTYSDYTHGFGDAKGEYWLGLENLFQLTSRYSHELLIVMDNFTDYSVFESYRGFRVEGAASLYTLRLSGSGIGTAGDAFSIYNNEKFIAYDSVNGSVPCAVSLASGFWHWGCSSHTSRSNLNGVYGIRGSDRQGIWWGNFNNGGLFDNHLKRVQMMIRIVA